MAPKRRGPSGCRSRIAPRLARSRRPCQRVARRDMLAARMLRASVLAILAGSLGTTLVVAQRCQGFAAFQGRPVQPFASALLGQDSRWYTAGVAVGGSGAFAQL